MIPTTRHTNSCGPSYQGTSTAQLRQSSLTQTIPLMTTASSQDQTGTSALQPSSHSTSSCCSCCSCCCCCAPPPRAPLLPIRCHTPPLPHQIHHICLGRTGILNHFGPSVRSTQANMMDLVRQRKGITTDSKGWSSRGRGTEAATAAAAAAGRGSMGTGLEGGRSRLILGRRCRFQSAGVCERGL